MANITIDGKQLTVPDGITIIEAIDRQTDSKLPRYCYHPGLSIAGNCRICQVEVEKMPRTVIACNTRVAEGMVIHTSSAKAKESQQIVLEFLLANHPLDCPVCDQAGECKLQDYYMDYGLYDPKFDDQKVKKTKKAVAVGPTIMLDQERCILCTRCVRFGEEITKTSDFGVFNRGDHSELDIYPGHELNNKYSGNVADICPVGALTDRDFRFKMRVWYLGKQKSVCPGCSRGCNTSIEFEKSRPYKSKKGRVMRLKPRENQNVNRWWICDEGRYAYKAIDTDRIEKIGGRAGAGKDWKSALESLALTLKTASASKWAVLVSPQATNEDVHAIKRVFAGQLKINQLAYFAPGQDGYQDEFLLRADKNPNSAGTSRILGLDEKAGNLSLIVDKAKKGELDGLVVFGHDLAKIFGAETLKTVREKVKTIIYEGPNNNPTSAAADWTLPGASYAEKDGTFVNFQGRVQRIRRAIDPAGDSRPTYAWLAELAAMLGLNLPFYRAELAFAELASSDDAFKGLDYKKIGDGGALWSLASAEAAAPKGLPAQMHAGAAR